MEEGFFRRFIVVFVDMVVRIFIDMLFRTIVNGHHRNKERMTYIYNDSGSMFIIAQQPSHPLSKSPTASYSRKR